MNITKGYENLGFIISISMIGIILIDRDYFLLPKKR